VHNLKSMGELIEALSAAPGKGRFDDRSAA
jgi:hypothetical protein